MSLDQTRPLVMATFKTVLGHGLGVGAPLIIADEPSAPGEIDLALAVRLFAAGLAGYADEVRPTPVETPGQELGRLAASAVSDAGDGPVVGTDDLKVWQQDDIKLARKAGQPVNRADLLAIAAREGVSVEGDDNKADLISKIMAHRAQAHPVNQANAESDQATVQGLGTAEPSTAPDGDQDADAGALGDAHGPAGE